MPRSGGKGKGGPKKGGENIGRALIKMHLQGTGKLKPRYANNMVSILDGNNLDDFIDTAEMEGNDFEVKRVHQNHAFLMEATTHRAIQTLSFSAFGHEQLSIPRKPAWTKTMTAEEVDRNEKNAFLQWRRDIAAVESNDDYTKKVTPFEKNLEVWRQLWRVCERSDLVIQIVDARNPLLYYTRDLMKYVSELQPAKKMILLVNKADFLTEYQRLVWAQYFTAIGVRFAFYSAFIEQSKLDAFGLVEDFEDSDVNEDEVRWLASDLVSTYASDAAQRPTEGLVFDPTPAESYLADQRTRAEETAAAQAILEKDRRGAIPATVEEQDEEEEESESEEESEDEEEEANAKITATAASTEAAQPAAESETATNEAEEDNEDNFIDYVQKTQVSKLRHPSGAEVEDEEAQSESDEGSDAEEANSSSAKPSVAFGGVTTAAARASVSGDQRRARLLTRGELILLLEVICDELRLVPQDRHDGRVCVGLVGYPNVGKSSCINTLLGVSKSSHGKVRVGVSSTPGKTKHFQTLILSDSVLLCDCPGLVFPSFMNSTGEMLCAGMLPINQMRDYQEPAAVIASRIPQYLLEASLGIKIYRHLDPLDKKDRPPTPSEMLSSYCESRGYITNGTGRWDEFRACKDMLVWYTDGKLLNVAVPPFDNLAAPTGQITTAAGAPVPAAPTAHGKMAADQVTTSADSPLRASLLARWVKETEKVMVRRSRVAERVSEQNNKSAAAAAALALEMLTLEESAGAAGLTQANLNKNTKHTHGGMVFEYATSTNPAEEDECEQAVRTDANGYEFVDDESSEDGLSGDETQTTAHGVPRREHKRLKTWGKKNRKLRSKDPYNDVNNLVAYSTNRVKGTAAPVVTTGREKEKLMRQSPQTAYGSPFVRAVMPHHVGNNNTTGVAGGSVAGSVQGSVRK